MARPKIAIPEEAIRLRSYQIWQEEGCPNGKALAHWLQAKAELEAQFRADPPLRRLRSFVIPRVPISKQPSHRVAAKIRREAT
jgi:hypothetical protein